MAKLTERQKKDGLKDSNECPRCYSENISAEEFEPETMSRKINCNSCNESWTECLTITEIID